MQVFAWVICVGHANMIGSFRSRPRSSLTKLLCVKQTTQRLYHTKDTKHIKHINHPLQHHQSPTNMSIKETTNSNASTVPIDNTATGATDTSTSNSPPRRPGQRLVKALRHLIPSKETLSKDLAIVGYGMAFSPAPVHFSYGDKHNDRRDSYTTRLM